MKHAGTSFSSLKLLARCGTRGGLRAFTLLELVLVLTIIAVTLSVALPSLGGFVHSRELADAATRFVATTRFARTQAISQATVYRVNIDSAQGRWSITRADATGANFVPPEPADDAEFTLSSKIQVSTTAAVHDGSQCIEFQPNGRCDTATVTFTGPNGAIRSIACDSPFDNYHIVLPSGGAR